jgi:hypothetical protein
MGWGIGMVSMTGVTEVESKRDLRDFIALPYRLYRRDMNYVPPLRSQVRDMLTGSGNILLSRGPYVLFLCRRRKRVVGRIMVGVDKAFDEENRCHSAWFSLFEAEDEAAASLIFKACEAWATAQGAGFLRGPEPADSGDTFKGILVMGFDGPPALMNTYNPPWYGKFLEQHGFNKQEDLFAYFFEIDQIIRENNGKVIQYAMDRYGYHIDRLDLKNLDRDLLDLHEILVKTIPAFPEEHMAVPTMEDVHNLARSLLPIADPDIIYLARTNLKNIPIGFVVALPDYNQVFRHIRSGRLSPLGLAKLLYYRKRIDAVRVFMQFVIPEYQRKAVNNAIFYRMCQGGKAHGYKTGDGSSIGENNLQSRQSVERLGGKHYRTYRMYRKYLSSGSD